MLGRGAGAKRGRAEERRRQRQNSLTFDEFFCTNLQMSQNHHLLIDKVVHRIATMLTPQEAERNLAAVTKFISDVVVKARPAMQHIALINRLRGAQGHPVYLDAGVEQNDQALWQANQLAFDNFLLVTLMGDEGYNADGLKIWAIEKASFMTLDFWVRMHVCLHALCRFWGFDFLGICYINGMRSPFILNQLPDSLLGEHMLPPEYVARHHDDPRRVRAPLVSRVRLRYYFDDCRMSPVTAWLVPTGNLATSNAWFHHCALRSQDVRFLRDHRATWSSIPHGLPNVHAYRETQPLSTEEDMDTQRGFSDDPQDRNQLS
jgi:hypothetical protein